MEADCRLRTARADTGHCQERQRQKKAETEKRQSIAYGGENPPGQSEHRGRDLYCTGPSLCSSRAGFSLFFFGTSVENFRQSRAQTVNKNFRNCKVSCIDLRNKVI